MRAQNHHEVTLAAAGFLGGEELEALLQEFQGLRLERIQIEYGWKFKASPADVERLLPRVRLILAHASRSIGELRPRIAVRVQPP